LTSVAGVNRVEAAARTTFTQVLPPGIDIQQKGTMDWITNEIALGDIEDSRDPEGVDAVLNVAAEVSILHDVPCLHLKIDDHRSITRRDLSRAIRFLTERTSVGQKVLVHCSAGISRSPAVVAAFLSATTGISTKDALKIIQQKRWIADPDPVVWESILVD
jgi:atypical dual specificity phosphatase